MNAFARFLVATALGLAAASAAAQAADGSARTLSLGPFDSITISGSAAVRFAQGEVDQIVIEGDASEQRSVSIELRDGKLEIDTAGAWKFWSSRKVQMTITARQLRRVSISGSASFTAPRAVRGGELSLAISGSGSVRFDDLQVERLRFAVAGSGDATLAGRAQTTSVAISGRGKFDGAQFASDSTKLAISGVADASVWALKELSIGVSGAGNVDVWGTPSVRRSVSGHADIRQHGDKPLPMPR